MRHPAAPMLAAALTWLGCQSQPPPEAPPPETTPFTPDDCTRQVQAITGLFRSRPEERDDQLREIRRLAAMYDRVKAMGTAPATLEQSCAKPLRDLTKELALLLHKRAQKHKDNRGRVIVEQLYRSYLDRFADQRDATELGFYHGEVLWTLERWREAANRYQWVAERDPDGKFAREAAYAAMLAWKNVLDGDRSAASGEVDAGLSPRPLTDDERGLLAAMDRYLAIVPPAGDRVQVEYRRARIYYDHNLFVEAIPLFQAVVDGQPEHELALYSANLVLDSLNALGRNRDLLRRVDSYLANPALMKDQEFADQLAAIKTELTRRLRTGPRRTP